MACLFVVDGVDGVGKTTQVALLAERFRSLNVDVGVLKFPNYEGVFGKAIKEYLDGKFGSLLDVHPKLAATLYLNDMRDSRDFLLAQLRVRQVVILDRYYCSTLAYQCGHADWNSRPAEEVDALAAWIAYVASREFLLPFPDLVIQLDGPAEVFAVRTAKRRRADGSVDIHEDDIRLQRHVRNWYARQASYDPITSENWEVVPVVSADGTPLSEGDVAALVWRMAVQYCRYASQPSSLTQ
jgi:dTMP kinase